MTANIPNVEIGPFGQALTEDGAGYRIEVYRFRAPVLIVTQHFPANASPEVMGITLAEGVDMVREHLGVKQPVTPTPWEQRASGHLDALDALAAEAAMRASFDRVNPAQVEDMIVATENAREIVLGEGAYAHAAALDPVIAALKTLLPPADVDLDAIAKRGQALANWSAVHDPLAYRVAAQDVPALIARVRAAEAERDLAIAHDRQPYPTAWAHEQALKALDKKQGELDEAHAALTSRTAETAEEWEYGARMDGVTIPLGPGARIVRGQTPRRRRKAGPWEAVPPTPEEPTP